MHHCRAGLVYPLAEDLEVKRLERTQESGILLPLEGFSADQEALEEDTSYEGFRLAAACQFVQLRQGPTRS